MAGKRRKCIGEVNQQRHHLDCTDIAYGNGNISFYQGTGYIQTNAGLYRSSDYGATWTIVTGTPQSAGIVQAFSNGKVILAGSQNMYVSDNEGENWESYAIQNYEPIQAMSFYDQNNGIAVGANGYAIKTTAGGAPSYPIATFNATSTVCTNENIEFENTTEGSYTYEWYINGQQVATSEDYSYSFSSPGSYVVSLRAYNANGYGIANRTVNVYDAPTINPINFAINDSICPNHDIDFTLFNSEAGVNYVIYRNGIETGINFNGNGNDVNVVVNGGGLAIAGNPSYYIPIYVKATKNGNCTSTTIYSQTDSTLVVFPSLLTSIYLPIDTVCTSGFYDIAVGALHSQVGYSYRWESVNDMVGPVEGNGDTVMAAFGSFAAGVRPIYLRVKHNALGCNYYTSIGAPYNTEVVSINEDLDFAVSTNVLPFGQSLNLTNNSTFTQYDWNLSELASNQYSNLQDPPSVSFQSAGRDSIILYGQMDADNSCNETVYRIVDVVASNPFSTPTFCLATSASGREVADQYIDLNNNSYSTGVMWSGSNKKLFLTKHAADGEVIFDFIEPHSAATNVNFVSGFAVDDSGNLYILFNTQNITSTFWGQPITSNTNICKISPTGQHIWTVGVTASAFNGLELVGNQLIFSCYSPASVQLTQANGAVYTATSTGTSNAGTGYVFSLSTDGMITRHSNFGRLLETIDYPSFSNAQFSGTAPIVKAGMNGDCIIAGLVRAPKINEYIYMDGQYAPHQTINVFNELLPAIYFMRYNPLTGVVHSRLLAISYFDESLNDFVELEDGSLVFSGNAEYLFRDANQEQNLRAYNPNSTYSDPVHFLYKVANSGETQWTLFNTTTYYDELERGPNNTFGATGIYNGIGTWLNTNHSVYGANTTGASDWVWMRYNANGILQNAVPFVAAGADMPAQFRFDQCGNPRIYFNNNVSSYTFPNTATINSSATMHFKTIGINPCNPSCTASDEIPLRDLRAQNLIVNPSSPTSGNTRGILLTLQNTSGTLVNNFNLNLRIDGGNAIPLFFQQSIAAGQTLQDFLITNHTFSGAMGHEIEVSISAVNGSLDINQNNDTIVRQFYICNGPMAGVYQIGQSVGAFSSISMAIQAMQNCGVGGPIEFLIEDGIYSEKISLPVITNVSEINPIIFRSISDDYSTVTVQRPNAITGNLVSLANAVHHYTFRGITFLEQTLTNNVFNIGNGSTDLVIEN